MKTNRSLFSKYEELQHLIEKSDHIDIKKIKGNVTLREFISGCKSKKVLSHHNCKIYTLARPYLF